MWLDLNRLCGEKKKEKRAPNGAVLPLSSTFGFCQHNRVRPNTRDCVKIVPLGLPSRLGEPEPSTPG